MEIFKLWGSVLVDTDKANASISKTGKEADGLSNKLGQGLSKGADIAGKAMLALGAAVIAGGAAIYGLASKAAETMDRIDKLSQKTGISRQAFQEWDYIMDRNGMSVDKLQVGVKTLIAQMDAASKGSKTAVSAFDRLGISWDDGTGKLKSQEQMLNETIGALAKMGNTTERARLATQLFGKSGAEMAPLLNSGAESIEALRKKAHELGLVFSDESVASGVLMKDTMTDLKATLGGLGTQIGLALMPIVIKFAEYMLANMPDIKEKITKAFEALAKIIMFLIENGRTVITILISLATAIALVKTAIAVTTLISNFQRITASGNMMFSSVAKWALIIIGVALAITALIAVINVFLGKGKQAKGEMDSIAQMTNTAQQSAKVPGYAKGTRNHPGGMAWVGEQGPELVNLPRGSQVFTNSESRDMANGSNIYNITIDAKNVKEFNDIVNIAQNQQRFSRMGVVSV